MNQTYIKLNVKHIETCGLRYAETQRNTSSSIRHTDEGLPQDSQVCEAKRGSNLVTGIDARSQLNTSATLSDEENLGT